jgi:hypothetical protein
MPPLALKLTKTACADGPSVSEIIARPSTQINESKPIFGDACSVFKIPIELPDFQEIGVFDNLIRLELMRKLDITTKMINQVHSNFLEPRKDLCNMGSPKPMIDLILIVIRDMI